MGGSGENNGIGEAFKRGGSTRATSIFMKLNRETKRLYLLFGKYLGGIQIDGYS
jgi:hypothetical protein